MERRERKPIAKNRRAFHEYEILETYEAGLVLTGTEVRSLRENNCQLTDCYALIRGGEAWLHGVHIATPIASANCCFTAKRFACSSRRPARRAWPLCRWPCISTRIHV